MSGRSHGARPACSRARRLRAGAGCALAMSVAAVPAQARSWHHGHHGSELIPGALLFSTSEYVPADITPGVTELPPGCGAAATLHVRDRRRGLPAGVRQRQGRRQLRYHFAD